jgi:hypothetical protein
MIRPPVPAPVIRLTRGVVLALLVATAACGGAAPPAASPSPAPSTPAGAPAGAATKGGVEAPESRQMLDGPRPAAEPPPPPPPPGAPPVSTEEQGVGAALRASRSELSRAEAQLEASQSDCTSACRALASMERATGHLCDMASEHDDRRTCEDAKTKVLRARDRIRSSCGSCPDGPSLDRGAPIPSRR